MGNILSTKKTCKKYTSNCLQHLCCCPFYVHKCLNTEQEVPQGEIRFNLLPTETDSTELRSEQNIQELIKAGKYFEADEHLIKLERQCYSSDAVEKDGDKVKMEKEVESMYELLDSAVTTALKASMSISQENPDLLKMVIQVGIREEKMDQTYLEEEKRKSGTIPKARPRGWRNKWMDILQRSVDERIGQIPSTSEENKTEWVPQCLGQLLKQLKEDVETIVNHVKPCYPEEYNVCKIYADCYHKTISSQFKLITENRVKTNNAYVLLCWIYVHYPGLMSQLTETKGEDQKLRRNSLLPQETISKLENEYISIVEVHGKTCMINSLQMEKVNWISEAEPLVLNDCYHSELPIDIIQIIDGAAREASCLPGELHHQVMCTMQNKFIHFLESYQKSVKPFEIKYWKTQKLSNNIICHAISIVNSCEHFRDYINTDKIKIGPVKQNALLILNDIEKKMKMFLSKTLFFKLKKHCKILMTSEWFPSQNPENNILKITEEHLTTLQKLKASHFQDVLEQIHHQLITEYVLRIMKKRLKVKVAQREDLAKKLESDARQLKKLFTDCGSNAGWLDAALPRIAEIIRLQDVDAIKVEFKVLSTDYPDIKKCHVEAILYIKKLKDKDIKKFLQTLDMKRSNSKDSSTENKLFTKSTILKDV